MNDLDELLTRLEELLGAIDSLEDDVRTPVFELLDGIDALHRFALRSMASGLDEQTIARLRARHPGVEWLFDAYGVGVDERARAEEALEQVRPYIDSHGGAVEVLDAAGGIVRLRLSGSCSGCTASDTTVTESIEQALRETWAGFVAVDVEVEDGPAHPPPVAVPLVQIGSRPPGL